MYQKGRFCARILVCVPLKSDDSLKSLIAGDVVKICSHLLPGWPVFLVDFTSTICQAMTIQQQLRMLRQLRLHRRDASESKHSFLLPEVDQVSQENAVSKTSRFQNFQSTAGWRVTAVLAFVATTVVFLANLAFLVWYYTAAPRQNGERRLSQGDCDSAARINTWVHLLINASSTILLAGSNFCTLPQPMALAPSKSLMINTKACRDSVRHPGPKLTKLIVHRAGWTSEFRVHGICS